LIARSLRWRLLIGAAAAIFVALLIAWLLMIFLFERHLERRLADELQSDGVRLVAGAEIRNGELQLLDQPTDARFEKPASGHYWQVARGDQLVRSPSLWDQALPLAADAPSSRWRSRIVSGPFQPRLILLERAVSPDGSKVLVQIAQDAAAIDVARAEFGRELALFLALLWLVLVAAAFVQVSLGLRPLARIREELSGLQQNPSNRLEAQHVTEVRPLVTAINSLAEAREADLMRARRRATDLAHALKTPLSAVEMQVRRAREEGLPVDGLTKAIEGMRRVVEAELARTRIAAVPRGSNQSSNVRKEVERLLSVLERTEAGEKLLLDNQVPAGLKAPVAAPDLVELLGAVAENAVRFARRSVLLAGSAGPAGVEITIDDDGPGIAHELGEAVLARGIRLDEVGAGQGIGLAMAREIMEATGGDISLSRSPLGGLRVTMHWPQGRD
jgi:signal transduction histidine kinase